MRLASTNLDNKAFNALIDRLLDMSYLQRKDRDDDDGTDDEPITDYRKIRGE
jgi:hypothetical protein